MIFSDTRETGKIHIKGYSETQAVFNFSECDNRASNVEIQRVIRGKH